MDGIVAIGTIGAIGMDMGGDGEEWGQIKPSGEALGTVEGGGRMGGVIGGRCPW